MSATATPKRIQDKRAKGWTFLYHVGSCEAMGTTPGTWREVTVIEISYLCGCVDLMTGKGASKNSAEKKAAGLCPNCQQATRDF